MTGLEQAALVVVAAWMAVLTFALVLVTRQIGLLTVRLSFAAPNIPVDEVGLPLGTKIPQEAAAAIGEIEVGRTVLFLSGTCGDCRSLATALSAEDVGPEVIALIGGRPSLAQDVGELLPAGLGHVFDPIASQVSAALGVDTVPFGMRINRGVIEAKAFLRSPADLVRLSGNGHKPEGRARLPMAKVPR